MHVDASARMMDEKEFRSSHFQRVYQYLRRHISLSPLDRFSYNPVLVEGKHVECLQVLLKYDCFKALHLYFILLNLKNFYML